MSGLSLALATSCTALLLEGCYKQCRNPKQAEFALELSNYVDPFRTGSWWKLSTSAGVVDSVTVFGYEENRQSGQEERDGECLYLPKRSFRLRATHTGGEFVRAEYESVKRDWSSLMMLSEVNGIKGTLQLSFAAADGFRDALQVDTTLGGTTYMDALVLESGDNRPNALATIILAKEIGLVAFTIGGEQYILVDYHIP